VPNLTQNEKGAITRFKNKAREFWNLWNSLSSKRFSPVMLVPEIKEEYDALIQRGETIRGSVESVTGLIDKAGNAYDNVKNWLSDTFGEVDIQRGQLGLIPLLIPVAAIAVSVAAMGKWISDAYQLNKRMDMIQKLIGQGMSPTMASRVVKDTMPAGFFGSLPSIALPLGAVALAWFISTRE